MAEWIKLLIVQTGNTEALRCALTLEAKAVSECPAARVAGGAMFSLCFFSQHCMEFLHVFTAVSTPSLCFLRVNSGFFNKVDTSSSPQPSKKAPSWNSSWKALLVR